MPRKRPKKDKITLRPHQEMILPAGATIRVSRRVIVTVYDGAVSRRLVIDPIPIDKPSLTTR